VVKRSKVEITRPINAHTVNVQYLPNGKAYEVQTWYTYGACRLMLRPEVRHIVRTERPTNLKLGVQMEYEDPHHRQEPWAPRSKVARSRNASDRCWPICRERNVLGTKIGRKIVLPRAIMRTSFKVKGQSSKSPGQLTLRPEVRKCVISSEENGLRTWNFVHL